MRPAGVSGRAMETAMMRWIRRPGVFGGKCGASWQLQGTAFLVRHCGHPTALWPYHGERPEGSMILDHNGRGFSSLAEAKIATELEAHNWTIRSQQAPAQTT